MPAMGNDVPKEIFKRFFADFFRVLFETNYAITYGKVRSTHFLDASFN